MSLAGMWVSLPPEVIQHRAARSSAQFLHDPAAVVGDAAGDRQLAGADVGHLPAPAESHHAHPPGVFDHRNAGGQVQQHLLRPQLLHVAESFLYGVRGVAQFDALADPIEDGGRNGHIAFGGIAVGDGADVGVDAENFLDDDHGPARLAGGCCQPGAELVAITGHQGGEFTHEWRAPEWP